MTSKAWWALYLNGMFVMMAADLVPSGPVRELLNLAAGMAIGFAIAKL